MGKGGVAQRHVRIMLRRAIKWPEFNGALDELLFDVSVGPLHLSQGLWMVREMELPGDAENFTSSVSLEVKTGTLSVWLIWHAKLRDDVVQEYLSHHISCLPGGEKHF